MNSPLRPSRGLALFVAVAASLAAQTVIPGKYYEYYVIARTGSGFTDLGSGGGPSINDGREVAFRGTTSAGNGLYYGTGQATAVNFNPGESFASSDVIQPSVQINANHQVVGEDRITTTSPATTNIRRYNAASTDAYIYAARGGPFHTGSGVYLYDAVFANPAVNKNGDVVFTAQYSSQAPLKVLGYLANGSSTPVEQPIRSGNPKPMIADNGAVVIQVGGSAGQSNNQILVYPPGLGSPAVIADTATNWTSLDNDPGISRDGRVVAFQGNLNGIGATALGTTTGPGIFAAIDEGSGFANAKIIRLTGGRIEDVATDRAQSRGNFDGICDPGEVCKNAAELGFDSSGNPITIASYGTDSRVGVVNVDFGASGIDDDSFVVSFIATPSSASRDNPALPGTPLLFSAQQGLWTIRVDVQKQLAGTQRVYHPFTPIPVVQIGDRLGPDTVTGIGVYDPIANAAHDESGGIRTMRRGDHRVAFWASTNNGQVIVRGNHLDSDQDGLLDHWETTGIDMDQDGVVDLRLSDYGADPFKRDLFLQVDWTGKAGVNLFQPAGAVFPSDISGTYSLFEANLRNAEQLDGALYGARIDGASPIPIVAGVTPHVDAGAAVDSLFLPISLNLNGGAAHGGNVIGMPGDANTIPALVYFGLPGLTVPGISVRSYQEIKDTYFGRSDKNARLLAFHYMVFAPFQDTVPNYPNTPYSATVATADQVSIELSVPHSAIPAVRAGAFVIVTSGVAASEVRQIDSLATDGGTGNLILNVGALNPIPVAGDTVAFLDGSTGLSEVAFAPSPDNNSLPGNDVIISAGAMGVLQGVPPNLCMEAETASHELGHTLGLRHGGDDQTSRKPGGTYMSVMSYTWQLECTPTPQVPNYSMSGDPTFDDYAHMQFNFSDVQFHLSTSLGEARGEGYASDLQIQDPEQTLLDYIAKNGPLDTVAPSVQITSPSGGATVSTGGNLTVNLTATDNVAISRVSVAFDANGNGVNDAGEAINATSTGGNTFQATFPVSGANGARTIKAIAWDTASNSTPVSITINVGTVAQVQVPNVVGLTQAAATTAITGAGLTVGTVTQQSSGTVPSGNVISQTPPASTSVSSGSAVNIVVSTGAAQVQVPNVVGLTQAAATTAITGAGLTVGTVTQQSSGTVPSGSVISQTPPASTSVSSGSAVNIVVSTGAAQVQVPNVVGLTQAAATTAITGAGLTVGTVTQQSSGTVPSGSVISQTPPASTSVSSGSAVNIVVSTGAAQVQVPSVVGLTQAAAATAITGAGLTVGTVTQQSSGTVPSGSVISQTPPASTSVSSGSAVNIVVSTGAAQVQVPNVVGLTQAAATTAITGAGLTVGTVTQQSSGTVPSGSVISQTPPASTSVSSGSAVNIVVSTGAAQVQVPNVVGLTQAAATTAITGAGLTVGTVTQQSSGTVPSGSVISQTPPASTSVSSGSAVNIVVSTGAAQVQVPNVVGLTQAAATTAITGAGLTVGTVTQQASSTVPSGSVISQTPPASTSVSSGSAVNIVVSLQNNSIGAAAGSSQVASIGAAFGAAFQALVKDGNGAPVSGITVTFTAPASGASGTFPGGLTAITAATNASGIATAAVFTANNTAGNYVVTATVTGASTPAMFLLTNSVGGATALGGAIAGKSGPSSARVWTFQIGNNGPATALNTQVTAIAFQQTSGAACTPVVTTPLPINAGNLNPGGSATVGATINFTGCPVGADFTVTVSLGANNGAATGSIVRLNQFQ